jgi:hypothetical protein
MGYGGLGGWGSGGVGVKGWGLGVGRVCGRRIGKIKILVWGIWAVGIWKKGRWPMDKGREMCRGCLVVE